MKLNIKEKNMKRELLNFKIKENSNGKGETIEIDKIF